MIGAVHRENAPACSAAIFEAGAGRKARRLGRRRNGMFCFSWRRASEAGRNQAPPTVRSRRR